MNPTASLVRRLTFVMLLVVSWSAMVICHEAGHIVCGWAGGGTLQHADLAPWRLPHSHFDPDPNPLLTLWGGPILGVLVPGAIAVVVRHRWMWFIASFCVLANGCYLALAWWSGESNLDTTKLLRHGASPTLIVLYCVVTIVVGYLGFRRQCITTLSEDCSESTDDSPHSTSESPRP